MYKLKQMKREPGSPHKPCMLLARKSTGQCAVYEACMWLQTPSKLSMTLNMKHDENRQMEWQTID